MLESKPVTKITQNVGWLVLGNMISKILFLVAGVVTARHLGTEAYGTYSFATFFSFIFATLADGGLQTILVREVSRDKSKGDLYFGSVLLLKSVMTLLASLLLSCAVMVMDLSSTQIQAVYVALAAFLALSYVGTAVAFFRAFERMAFEGIVTALQGVLFLVLVAVGSIVGANLLLFVAALLVSYVVSALLAYYWVLTRFARPRFRLDAALAKFLIREAWPVGVSLFLFILHGRIGVVVLEAMRNSAEVGAFGAAFNLVRNLNFVPLAFTAAVLPPLAQSAVSNRQRFFRLYTVSFKAMLLLGFPLAVGGMLLAEPIIHLVYGPEFAEAIVAFRIISWSVLFSFLSLVSKAALESANRQVQWTRALAIGVPANLLLNVLLVPRFGVAGASRALLFADILIFLVALYAVLREFPEFIMSLIKLGLTTLGSVVLMGLTLELLGRQHLVLAILGAALTYVLSLILFGVVGKEDLGILKRAASGRN